MDFLWIAALLIAMAWGLWFGITLNSIRSSLQRVSRELQIQSDLLEVIATNEMFAGSEPDRETSDGPTLDDYWCPNCREAYQVEVGSVGQCPSCRRIGHLYDA